MGDEFAMIDPCVLVDSDGQAYFYYGGGGRCVGARLKDNMVELAEPLRKMEGLTDFHEATWVHKHGDWYYLSYADNHVENDRGANRLHYAMSKNPLGLPFPDTYFTFPVRQLERRGQSWQTRRPCSLCIPTP